MRVRTYAGGRGADACRRPQRIDKDGKHRFLIDGFPRQMDQAIEFDRTVSYEKGGYQV